MNQQTILQSNLLDIIFENRNKEYGAYTLRKFYESRLTIAVFSTAGLTIIFSVFLLFQRHYISAPPLPVIFSIPEIKPLPYTEKKEVLDKQILPPAATKIISKPVGTPVIVTGKINILPATLPDVTTSITSSGVSDVDGAGPATGSSGTGRDTVETIKQPAVIENSGPVAVAEIMPQYPGGIKALLAFLKKNIHAPETLSEGEDVGVEVQFVVNYNGNLENFTVTKSGGDVYNTEVLRVLKKMPLWIPGKTAGKNISVYYRVPVKFTSQF